MAEAEDRRDLAALNGFGSNKAASSHSKRVLVLVLGCDRQPWRRIEAEGQRTTWLSNAIPNVRVLYYYGTAKGLGYWSVAIMSKGLHVLRQERLRGLFLRLTGSRYALAARETGDRLYLQIPETFGNIGAKTVGALRYVLGRYEFDYVYRTNISSYTHLPLLQEFVQSLPETRYYGGFLGQERNISFAAGSGILFSRDLVEFAARDPEWNWELMDDVALACSMTRAGVQPQAIPRIDIDSPDKVALVAPDRWRTCFSVRCKSAGNRLQDIETMRRVHAVYLRAWNA